jgi:hypothetical protein
LIEEGEEWIEVSVLRLQGLPPQIMTLGQHLLHLHVPCYESAQPSAPERENQG